MNIHGLQAYGKAPWINYNNYIEDLIISEACDPKSVSIDVGCFTGRFTWLMSRLSKLVYAFDPSPALLEKGAPKHPSMPWTSPTNKGNVIFVNCALSDRRDSLTYTEYNDGSWNSLLPDSIERAAKLKKINQRTVPVMPLDDIVRDSNVSLLKVDAEGYDFGVIRGASAMIKRARPVILVELVSSVQKKRASAYIEKMGYDCYNLGWTIDPEKTIDVNMPSLNILCVPKEKTALRDRMILRHNMIVNLYELTPQYDAGVFLQWMKNQFSHIEH